MKGRWLLLVAWIAMSLLFYSCTTEKTIVYKGNETNDDIDDDTDDDIDDDTDDDTDDDADDDTDDDVEEPPAAPSNLEVTEVKKYQATLNWVDNADNEDGFTLERQTDTKDWEKIADLPANTEEYTDTTLECDRIKYEYRVKAYNGVGDSDYSNTDDATTLDCWTIYRLNSTGDVGAYTSIALDSNDKVHISYCDLDSENLKYATNVSGSWQYHTLDSTGDVGWHTSIALDSNDKAHIGYGDSTNYSLKYITNKNEVWQVFTLDLCGEVGCWFPSVVTDIAGYVHISYSDLNWSSPKVKYATNASGSWRIYTLDAPNNISLWTSIELDSNGKVHISYFECENILLDCISSSLNYITNTSGSWAIYTLDSGDDAGWWTSIALDSNDKVHISYFDCSEGSIFSCSSGDLKYVTNALGSWQYFTVDSTGDAGEYTSIAIDSNDKVHISYYDFTNGNLKYATNAEE